MMMQPNDLPEDETILRVKAALRPLPPPDPHAVARVLSAVHGRTPQPTPRWREFLDWMRVPSLSVAGATGLMAIALFAGYIAKGRQQTVSANSSRENTAVVAANGIGDSGVQFINATKAVPVVAASAVAGAASGAVSQAERAVPVQLVLELPNAHTVSVVGDFNDWTVDQAPMQKFANGAWSITLPVKPGRHEYAFVVDGVRWMADPRAPKAHDSDFGKPGSVMMVTPQ